MPNWLRALIAGYGAKKLGGGCLSTIFIFIVIYYALGQCNHPVVGHSEVSKPQNVQIADERSLKSLQAVCECKTSR